MKFQQLPGSQSPGSALTSNNTQKPFPNKCGEEATEELVGGMAKEQK